MRRAYKVKTYTLLAQIKVCLCLYTNIYDLRFSKPFNIEVLMPIYFKAKFSSNEMDI